jgi:hypothetical protein
MPPIKANAGTQTIWRLLKPAVWKFRSADDAKVR